MNRTIIRCLFFLLALMYACRKCPSADELQGTWIEQGGYNSKLVFSGDHLFFYHSASIDSFSYTLDRKHYTLLTTDFNNPTVGGKTYAMDYHKRKKILTVMGLFPSAFDVSKSYYKKQ